MNAGDENLEDDRQMDLPFDEALNVVPVVDALDVWHAQRAREMAAVCERLGLPLGHMAEVCLSQGPVLRGVLRMAEERLWVEGERDRLLLRIGEATFGLGEIESAVRLEE